jgi:hypothetical protein
VTPYELRAQFERCVASGAHKEREGAALCPACGLKSAMFPSFQEVLASFNGSRVDTRGVLAAEINAVLTSVGLRHPRVKGFTDRGDYILTARGEALGDDAQRLWRASKEPRGHDRMHEGQGGRSESDPPLVKAKRVWEG